MSARIPTQNLSETLVAITDPHSVASEQYRQLRTSIDFLGIDKPLRSVMVTSAVPGAGKSLTAANLAMSIAQSGTSTLLIDADLRRPTIHKLFGLTTRSGLTTALTRIDDWAKMIMDGPLDTLQILPCGPIPPNPSELLSSAMMRRFMTLLTERFEMIIIDTPPVVAFTDAVVLGQVADGTLLVVRSGLASQKVEIKAKERLTQVHARLLGIVFNGVNDSDSELSSYYYGYGDNL